MMRIRKNTSGWPEGRLPGAAPVPTPTPVAAATSVAGAASVPGGAIRVSRSGYLGGQGAHVQEAERVLSHVAAARDRTEQARRTLLRSGADPALIEALADTEQHLRAAQRRLVGALDGGAPGTVA